MSLMRRKLGLLGAGAATDAEEAEEAEAGAEGGAAAALSEAAVEDEGLAAALLSVMEATGADFTNTFRCGRGGRRRGRRVRAEREWCPAVLAGR